MSSEPAVLDRRQRRRQETIEEVLDVCGMPRLEALKTLVDLLERGAIRVQSR